jgi:putative protein-disulfide isomerase
MPVELRYYTDPACSWSWGTEPKLRRLQWEFGDGLRVRFVMGGLARRYDSEYRDPDAGIGPGGDVFADLTAHWLDATARSGMPCDPRLWTLNPISSTYPACQAVTAAAEQGDVAAYRYLRRLREGLLCERRKLDHVEALVGEAGAAGLDPERFRVDLTSNAITEALGADLEEARALAEEARPDGGAREGEMGERVSLPSIVFSGDEGQRHAVWGVASYEAYRQAAMAAGAQPVIERPAEVREAIERFGRCATREIEELTQRPRPVVEAELWSLARDWRLKSIPVLIGTLWELA